MIFAFVSVLVSVATTEVALNAMTMKEISDWLSTRESAAVTFEARLTETVRRSVGTAYTDGPLGEGPGAKYDDDPLVNLREVDCVTFIEQSLAFSAASSYDAAVDLLQSIRYKGGKIDYGTRNHFFVADWLKNNGRWCRDISGTLGVETIPLTRTVDRAGFFKRLDAEEVGAGLQPEAVTVNLIPSSQAEAAEKTLPNACIITFVGKAEWLFALHCGLWLKDAEGGKLYHASSQSGQVVAVDLSDYVKGQGERYMGFLAHQASRPTR
ncbi:MAG: D-alanyl-D-alanine carboxypeptidase/D-alanyl-D-alanine-endopeptidase [Candidatus Hydrogenedentota bacterium]|jgi:hypothetical protein